MFFLTSLFFTLMSVAQIHLYLLLAELKLHLLQSHSNKIFLFSFGKGREVRSCAFVSNILLMLLAIWALRHDFVLRTGLQCNAVFLVLLFFPAFFLLGSCLFLIPRLLKCIFCAVAFFFLFLSLTNSTLTSFSVKLNSKIGYALTW